MPKRAIIYFGVLIISFFQPLNQVSAHASDCPSSWQAQLLSPQQIANKLNVTIDKIGNYDRLYVPPEQGVSSLGNINNLDANGNLTSKLSQITSNAYSGHVTVQYSTDGMNWTSDLAGFTRLDYSLMGYSERIQLDLATSTCPTPFNIYSSITKFDSVPTVSGSIDQVFPFMNFQVVNVYKSDYQNCKVGILNSLTGKNEDWFNNERCQSLLGIGYNLTSANPGPSATAVITFLVKNSDGSLIPLQKVNSSHGTLIIEAYTSIFNANQQATYYKLDSFNVPAFSKSVNSKTGTPKNDVKLIKWICIKGHTALKGQGLIRKCPIGYKLKNN
jgi:hypothetical protein